MDVMHVTWILSVYMYVTLVMLNGTLLFVLNEQFFNRLVENKFYRLHQLNSSPQLIVVSHFVCCRVFWTGSRNFT